MRRITIAIAAAALLLTAGERAAADVCSQPASEGPQPVVRDCIYIARASIGLTDCMDCFCDVDGSGSVQMTDALACLRHVVGNEVELACPECLASTTTTIPGCASCNDVLTKAREYEDLCPLAKFLYDDMRSCPYTSCRCVCGCPPGYVCPAVCLPGCCGETNWEECVACLLNCGETVRNCAEN